MPAKPKNAAAVQLGASGGKAGKGDAKRRSSEHYSKAGTKGARAMLAATAGRRSEIGRKAAQARWANKDAK